MEALRGDSLSEVNFELEWMEMVKGIEEERKLASSVGPLDMFKGACGQVENGRLVANSYR